MPQLCTRRTLYDDCSTWRKSGKPRWRLLWRGRQRELLSSLEVGVAHDMSVGAEMEFAEQVCRSCHRKKRFASILRGCMREGPRDTLETLDLGPPSGMPRGTHTRHSLTLKT